MRARILPAEVFVIVEFFTIISMIYAPGPFLTGKGYTDSMIVFSCFMGVALSLVAYCNGILHVINFHTHRLVVAAVGVIWLGVAALASTINPIPSGVFLTYGLLLTMCAVFCKTPRTVAAVEPEHVPVKTAEQPVRKRAAA